MIEETLFRIPFWSIPTLNFSTKKKQLTNLFKAYPDRKHGIQTFETNRQNQRQGLKDEFVKVMGEELNMLSKKLQKDIEITDVWSVTYRTGDYHTPHNHGSTGLSGILYLNLDKNSPPTTYLQPWNDWYSDRTIMYPMPVQEGQIVVIPQFINHFSEPNKAKKIKRIISWDMKIY